MKRIATIQDFSCVGRCSLSVALPIISAAGIECCGIPTAVLSNHTGFPTFFKHDLTDCMNSFADKIFECGITFDAVYTGYLASASQIGIVEGFIERARREDMLVIVDPAMADDGVLYSQITPEHAEKMRQLCALADVITPNVTEACLLLGEDMISQPTEGDIRTLLEKLVNTGAKNALITGVEQDGKIGAAAFDGSEFFGYFTEKIPLRCMGTGDIFASALTASLVNGNPLKTALERAVTFVGKAVSSTYSDPERRFYGVNFESVLADSAGLLK